MLGFLKKLLGFPTAQEQAAAKAAAAAPYKIEAPVVEASIPVLKDVVPKAVVKATTTKSKKKAPVKKSTGEKKQPGRKPKVAKS